MIKLENLNKEITTIKGQKIAGLTPGTILTYRDAFIVICEFARNLKPGESIKVFDIALKINNAEDSIDLDEQQFELLKNVVENSEVFVAGIIGKLCSYLQECKSKVESNKS